MSDTLHSHIETIRCPECHLEQEVTVLHTNIDRHDYFHVCYRCGYDIEKSKWEKVERCEAVS